MSQARQLLRTLGMNERQEDFILGVMVELIKQIELEEGTEELKNKVELIKKYPIQNDVFSESFLVLLRTAIELILEERE